MRFQSIKSLIPEFFLIASIIYYWSLTSNLFNPIAIGLLAVIIYQIIFKKRVLGLIISTLIIGLNLFLILALISELSEFEVINQNWKKLAIVGSLYLGLNLVLAGFMFFKHLKLKTT